MAEEVKETEKTAESEGVPLAALQDERHKRQRLETDLAELRGQIQGMATTAKRDPVEQKTLSAGDLRRAVDEGRLSEDESTRISERQLETRLRSEIGQDVRREVAAGQVADRVNEHNQAYRNAIPELDDRDSKQFAALQKEFDQLVRLGYDAADPRTEVAANRAAFGDVTRLRTVKADAPRTHLETGGSDAGGERPDRSDGWPKDMPARSREYYQTQIIKGGVANQAAAIKEWSYKPKHAPTARRAA